MFTISFIILLSIVTMLNNKQQDISDENTNSFKFDKSGIITMMICFFVGLLLDFTVKKFFYDKYFIVLGVYSFLSLAALVIINQFRLNAIEREKEEIKQIFEILDSLVMPKNREIDYNEVPFKIIYNKGNKNEIDKVIVNMENPEKFKDASITQAVYNFNKFLPYREWIVDTDFPERTCTFIGNKLPPNIALFPGSDLRPWNWIPLGLGGNGELGWNLGAKSSNIGESLYIYEDSNVKAGTIEVSKAPQALTVGSTGGGKAIFIGEIVDIIA